MKKPEIISMRATAQDHKILAALSKKLGLKNPSIIRQAIRMLATKEGITA
jgi:hypothetical protein